jgi:hypothetical protein
MESCADEKELQKHVAQGLNSCKTETNEEIPFVDDCVEAEKEDNDNKRPARVKDLTLQTDLILRPDVPIHSPNSDTIVVNTPEGTLYITLSPDSTNLANPTSLSSPSTQSTDVTDSPSTSKGFGAEESQILIDNEIEMEQRRKNLRRNSISMPTLQNLELEVLKQQYLNPQDEVSAVTIVFSF